MHNKNSCGCWCSSVNCYHNVAKGLKNYNVRVIADGGIRYSGDIVKALALEPTW